MEPKQVRFIEPAQETEDDGLGLAERAFNYFLMILLPFCSLAVQADFVEPRDLPRETRKRPALITSNQILMSLPPFPFWEPGTLGGVSYRALYGPNKEQYATVRRKYLEWNIMHILSKLSVTAAAIFLLTQAEFIYRSVWD